MCIAETKGYCWETMCWNARPIWIIVHPQNWWMSCRQEKSPGFSTETDCGVAGVVLLCNHAGNDLVMPGMQADLDDMMDALSNPEHACPITKAQLQVTAERVLEMVLKLT